MILSMTGYGKASCEYGNKKITVEIKSLNSKQMDASTRIASLYREKDIEIRNLITQKLERGKVDFALYIEDAGSQVVNHINQTVVENYYQQITETAAKLNIPVPENWMELLLRLPDVLKSESTSVDEDEWNTIVETINQAMNQLVKFRAQEGKSLEAMFTSKIERIGSLLKEVDQYEGERLAKIKMRLEENLKAIDEKVNIDRNRLEQELIFYIEKLDVNEEKLRLGNHLNYFLETMRKESAPGKKLGFIAQEMGREINTLGSKSNHSEMQIIVVQMKDELEQIKEQVLNVL